MKVTKEQIDELRAFCLGAARIVESTAKALDPEDLELYSPFVMFCPECNELEFVDSADYWQGHPVTHKYATGTIWFTKASAEDCVNEILDQLARLGYEIED